MTTFLVEAYAPAAVDLAEVEARAHAAAAALAGEGVPVHYVRPILVPGDETCFHLTFQSVNPLTQPALGVEWLVSACSSGFLIEGLNAPALDGSSTIARTTAPSANKTSSRFPRLAHGRSAISTSVEPTLEAQRNADRR
jgi:hypothetical protein